MSIVYYYQPDSAFTGTHEDNIRSFHTESSEYTVRLSKWIVWLNKIEDGIRGNRYKYFLSFKPLKLLSVLSLVYSVNWIYELFGIKRKLKGDLGCFSVHELLYFLTRFRFQRAAHINFRMFTLLYHPLLDRLFALCTKRQHQLWRFCSSFRNS